MSMMLSKAKTRLALIWMPQALEPLLVVDMAAFTLMLWSISRKARGKLCRFRSMRSLIFYILYL